MLLKDNSFDAALSHWAPNNDGPDHPFDVTDSGPPSTALPAGSSVFDIDNITMVEMGSWFLEFQPDSGLDECAGSIPTDSHDELARRALKSDQPHADETYCRLPSSTSTPTATVAEIQVFGAVGQQHGEAPEQAASSALSLPVISGPAGPCPSPPTGTPPSPVLALSCGGKSPS